MQPYNVGILGATGLVGQRLIERLTDHPWFRITALAASDRSAGRPYAEAATWRLSASPPRQVAAMVVRRCAVDELGECDLVLSALDAQIAREVEPQFAQAGLAVISNSSAFRQHEEVPLLVPEVNASHLELIEAPRRRNGGGFIVTNPNCSTTGLALALAPLHLAFGIEKLVVATLQAISGAGIDGLRAFDLVDNVVPYIPTEEEKIEQEMGKILGTLEGERIHRAELAVSAHCHRVPTLDGHLEAVSVGLRRRVEPVEVVAVLEQFRGEVTDENLPSAIERPIVVRAEPDRPQPRLDRDCGNGMSVVVGRVRRCPVLDVRLALLSHNTVRGAAGGTLLNAELLAARDLLPRRNPA